jgi:adenylate cyclase
VRSNSVEPTDDVGPVLSIGFRTSIITLFVGILLFVGLSLVYLSFRRATVITEAAAARLLERVAEHAADRIDTQFKDVHDSLEVLKQLPSIQSANIADNGPLYALMAAMLRSNVHLYNAYVGYDDGAFLQMDVIDRAGPAYRNRLGAPENATFRLLSIAPSWGPEGFRKADISFLSDDLVRLASMSALSDFDPRTRPWFVGAAAAGAGILTDPYIFHATGLPGYTVRAAIGGGRKGVVVGDVMLGEAEDLLRRQQLGASGRALLFDREERVIAYPGLGERVAAQGAASSGVELPTLADVDRTGIAPAVKAWERGGSAQQVFRGFDGRMYAAAFQSIKTASSANLRLVVLAPLEEFFSDIEREKRLLFLITLAFVLGLIPFAFWIGSKMSQRFHDLADETDRIRHFDVADRARQRSVIREIDDLGRSVHMLRSVVQTFSRFVPRRLVQQLVESQTSLTLGGTRREVTVLFTDVENFTAIAERADPEQVMIYTSRYFAALSNAIMTSGGVVDKFIGDAVMAIWNAPNDDADHVRNACEAVMHCLDANHELNGAFLHEGWPVYRTRFGLHVGDALVGNIGSADRMNFTALGATVNLAARLESLNKVYGTTVLVTENIRDVADEFFVFRCVDRVRPKGFDQSFRIFELRCRRGLHTRTEAEFCRRWNVILERCQNCDETESLSLIEGFLDCYPDDRIASFHAARLRGQLRLEAEDTR